MERKIIKSWFVTQKLTPLSLIYTVVAIFYFIFMETDIYASLSDVTQICIFTVIIVVGVLLGVSILNVKKVADEMVTILKDKSLNADEKVNRLTNLALMILGQLGRAWELLNDEQFDKSPEPNGTTATVIVDPDLNTNTT